MVQCVTGQSLNKKYHINIHATYTQTDVHIHTNAYTHSEFKYKVKKHAYFSYTDT